jgi:Arc/MetJ family transcription regulator
MAKIQDVVTLKSGYANFVELKTASQRITRGVFQPNDTKFYLLSGSYQDDEDGLGPLAKRSLTPLYALRMCTKRGILVYTMRTNIEIDDELMKQALEESHARTKKEAVDMALRELIASRRRRKALDLEGKMDWQGDLDQMREFR